MTTENATGVSRRAGHGFRARDALDVGVRRLIGQLALIDVHRVDVEGPSGRREQLATPRRR